MFLRLHECLFSTSISVGHFEVLLGSQNHKLPYMLGLRYMSYM